MPFQKILFTDIDGTLVDINTAEYGKETNKLIKIIKEKNIPLILTSAKTRLEQNKIREDLGLSDPFIVENGGAIVIPKGYFPDNALRNIGYLLRETQENENDTRDNASDNARYVDHTTVVIIELGKSADYVRAKLSNIRKRYNISFRGVADISIEELSNFTSISKEQARRMAQRDYGETILQIQNEDIARFIKYVQEEGMKVIHGGRFFDVTVGTDKGIAVGILKKLFKDKFHNNVTFFGIGDSTNDIPMLNLMDIPILVQRQDSSWINYSGIKVKNATSVGSSNSSISSSNNVIKIKGIGPSGWENAIRKIILELN
ncbi:MAG: HAD-IIB family hydrolase [Thermoproteota archaeon]|nr:HAD-IIB family hydrolase [Thermoproteota archaeon]